MVAIGAANKVRWPCFLETDAAYLNYINISTIEL